MSPPGDGAPPKGAPEDGADRKPAPRGALEEAVALVDELITGFAVPLVEERGVPDDPQLADILRRRAALTPRLAAERSQKLNRRPPPEPPGARTGKESKT